ncbi:hypothetical protein ACLQ3C_13540 [Gordonia sp. DT30]|uniref:hypothetical protein n=1 Tax=Gordonia sp. DT30 TaxID=3416546 RepID=UPI003CF76962
MTPSTDHTGRQLSRRAFLGAAALGTAGVALGTGIGIARADTGWPTATLTGASATSVTPSQFMPSTQLRRWQELANDVGLRATGTTAQHRYVDGLVERMAQAGIRNIVADQVRFTRWLPSQWSLDVIGGAGAGPAHVSWYVPYSGSTAAGGITAPLSTEPREGAIGLFTVEVPSLPYALLDAVDYDTPLQPHHGPGYNPFATYDRAWLGQGSITEAMDRFKAAGAVGLIVIWDLPREAADGQYAPYDGIIRNLPALSVDRVTGARLHDVARAGGSVRLRLQATVNPVTSPNMYGIIPGRTDEFVMLQSHTDGTNGLEENGPEGLLSVAQYLARIPRHELGRSILFVMSTGHMAGQALGTEAFLRRHKGDLVARTAAAISIEHLGARSWVPTNTGGMAMGGPETNIVFSSPHAEMVKVGRAFHNQMGLDDNRVLRPYSTDKSGESPNGRWWPGDGEGLWRIAGLPSLQSIAGPNYLLNANFDAMPFIDIDLMRRQCIATTNAALRLARTPRRQLQAPRADDALWGPPLDLVNKFLL